MSERQDSASNSSGQSGKLLSSKEAAEYLGISQPTINRWVRSGRIKSTGVSKWRKFRIADLDAFIAAVEKENQGQEG